MGSLENIYQKNVFEIAGCVYRSTAKSGKSGIYGVVIQNQGEEETLATYDGILARRMRNNIDECFSFTVYRHSFIIPNIGPLWLVEVNPEFR